MPLDTGARCRADFRADEIRDATLVGITGVPEIPDEALLEGYAVGDAHVGARFVAKFSARVYGVALAITDDRRDAEEVAQDAFVRAWRYAASFDARRGTVLGWLLGIARNAAMDRVRVRARRPEMPMPEIATEAVADTTDPEAAADQNDTLSWVAARLGEIPAPQRDALLAASIHGLSAREIADATGVPIGTIKTRIRAALRQLRERIPEHVPCEP
jgi:RNA polymerase sigma factor (sigma-70 family)